MEAQDRFNIVGTIVDGRYRVERVVGEGGFGVVYRAHHLRLDGRVALKVLKLPDDPAAREAMIGAFETEGKLLFSLASEHSCIVRVLESGALLSPTGVLTPYLVLEWLDGVTLDVELRYRAKHELPPMTLAETVALLTGPVEALAAAHRNRIAHRDLKPANLFLVSQAGQLTPKLLDFGTAKLIEASYSATAMFALTEGAACSFTPAYGAPEQWRRELGATGPWTDVYALALLCLEVLSGRPVFHGRAGQILVSCMDEDDRPSPRKLGVDVPDAVERAFTRALSVKPRARFADAAGFWQAICDGMDGALLEGPRIASLSDQVVSLPRPSLAAGIDPIGVTQPASTAGNPGSSDRPAPVGSRPGATTGSTVVHPAGTARRNRSVGRMAVGTLVAVLLIGAIVAGIRLRSGGHPAPPAESAVARQSAQPFARLAPVQDAAGRARVEVTDASVADAAHANASITVIPRPSRAIGADAAGAARTKASDPEPEASGETPDGFAPPRDRSALTLSPPSMGEVPPAESAPPVRDDLPTDRK